MVASSSQHALYLVILALLEDNVDLVVSNGSATARGKWRWFIVQLYARHELSDQGRRRRRIGRCPIQFGYVPFWRRLRMNEGTIVRHQQQTCGVVIEPTDRLYIAPAELLRQYRQYPGMVARLAGTFEICRLVQGDVDMFPAKPFSA